jgi:hypothetical protein
MISLLDRYKQQWNPTSPYRPCNICCPLGGSWVQTSVFETTAMAYQARA